jgi:hypothetical protein
MARAMSGRHWLRGMLLQHLLEIASGVGCGMSGYLFRGARHHDLAPLIAAIRTEINNPIGAADHIEVVLRYPKILVGI